MGVRSRKLKEGIRWQYYGSVKGKKFYSPWEYLTKEEAEKAERIYRAQERAKEDSLAILIDLRLKRLQARYSKGHVENTARSLYKLLERYGDIPVTGITKNMVRQLLDAESLRLQLAGKTNHEVNTTLECIKAFFYFVIDDLLIDMSNPCRKVPKYPIEQNLKYIPTSQEIDYLRSKMSQAQLRLYDFVTQTGCRIGEALRFEVSDIKMRKLDPHWPGDDCILLWSRKTRDSDLKSRPVPIPDVIHKWMEADSMGVAGFPKEGRVFKRWNARPRFLEDLIKKHRAAFKHSWNWHNLRHHACSQWMDNGMTLTECMSRLGHSSIETTMNYLQSLGFTNIK
jgi:integrase